MDALRQLRSLLQITYGIFFLIFGLDKFVNVLTNWISYVNDFFTTTSINPQVYAYICGAIEVVIGAVIFIAPKLGGRMALIWLVLMAALLAFGTQHHMVMAVRNIVLAIGTFVLVRLIFIIKAEEDAID